MTVSFLDVDIGYLELHAEVDDALSRVAASGWYIGGPEAEAFESDLAAYCEARHSVGVANRLNALHLSLRALEVGPMTK